MVGLSFEQLFTEPLVAVVRAGHPLALGPGLPATSLEDFPVVLPPFGTLIRQSADSLLIAWGVQPLSAFVEVLSVSTGRALTLENDAVWFVPLSAVEYELAHGMLARLPLPFAGTGEPVGLIRRSDTQPSPVARAFIDAVREVAQQRMAAAASDKPVRKRSRRKASAA
jgi:LysR family pca operon transcriptional activator